MGTSNLSVEERLIVGDKVLIQGGIFDGLTGIVYRKNGRSRFCVQISAINQIISVDIDTSDVSMIKLVKQ